MRLARRVSPHLTVPLGRVKVRAGSVTDSAGPNRMLARAPFTQGGRRRWLKNRRSVPVAAKTTKPLVADGSAGQERREKLAAETDDLLDEIDDVLEENAEDFVRALRPEGRPVTVDRAPRITDGDTRLSFGSNLSSFSEYLRVHAPEHLPQNASPTQEVLSWAGET